MQLKTIKYFDFDESYGLNAVIFCLIMEYQAMDMDMGWGEGEGEEDGEYIS